MTLGFPISYSFLRDEENCPYKAYRRYVVRDLPKEKTPELELGNKAHKALEERVGKGKKLPDEFSLHEPVASVLAGLRETMEVDTERVLTLDKNEKPYLSRWSRDAYVFSRIDVTVRGLERARIFDWKTGKKREDPFELEIQAWLLRCWYPKLETISGNYIWLKENELGYTHDLSDTERTAASVRRQVAEIESRGDDWPKRPNPLCGWCNVLDCEYNKSRK